MQWWWCHWKLSCEAALIDIGAVGLMKDWFARHAALQGTGSITVHVIANDNFVRVTIAIYIIACCCHGHLRRST
jgi:hypothetical protein